MKKLLILSVFAAASSGCVGYPRVYLTKKSGTADLEGGQPITIKASIIKQCETLAGETEDVRKTVETRTDAQGRYTLHVRGVAWHWKNLFTLDNCASRIQLFVCRDFCKPADDIDINVLGK